MSRVNRVLTSALAPLVIATVAAAAPPAAQAQRLQKIEEWEVPEGVEVVGAAALSQGGVAVWTSDDTLRLLDDHLTPVRRISAPGHILSAGVGPSDVLQVVVLDPPRLLQPGRDGRAAPILPFPLAPGTDVQDAVQVGSDWYFLVAGDSASAPGMVLHLPQSTLEPHTIANPVHLPATLSRVGSQLAITEARGTMASSVRALDGSLVQRLEPRASVIDSLTNGTLGFPGADWRSSPLLAFHSGGYLQPIRDLASERTIIMSYDSDGVPRGWPVILGADLEAFSYDPDTGILLGIVQHDGHTTVQKLRWMEKR